MARFADTAPHIRGRVFRAELGARTAKSLWAMEVVNTATGQVLITDNTCDRIVMLDECRAATAAARAAWSYDLRRKDLL